MPIDPTQVTINDLPAEDPQNQEEEETPEDDPVAEEDEQELPSEEEQTEETGEEEVPEDQETDEQTDEKTEQEETEEAEVSLFEELGAELGMDEAIDGEEYDETVDGFVEFTEDAVQTAMQNQWNEVFEQYPDVQQYVQYRMQGGDPEEYQETVFDTTWENQTISEEDTQQQKEVIRENLSDDFDEEEIEEFIDEYEAAGTLNTEAKKSLRQLQREEERQKEQLIQQQEEEAKRQQEQVQEFWNDVQSTIEERDEFHGIPVPEGEKDDFFSFMAEDVTDGQGLSRRDQMVQEMDMEDRIAVDLILYYDFDLDKLAELKAKTKNAESLRDRLKSSKGRADVTDQQEKNVNDDIDPERDIPDPTQLIN